MEDLTSCEIVTIILVGATIAINLPKILRRTRRKFNRAYQAITGHPPPFSGRRTASGTAMRLSYIDESMVNMT